MGGHITGPHKSLILLLSPLEGQVAGPFVHLVIPLCFTCTDSLLIYPIWGVWLSSISSVKNVQKATGWAVKSREERSSKWWWWTLSFQLIGVPYTDTALNYWLLRFIVEGRWEHRQLYYHSSISNLFEMSIAIGRMHCNFMSSRHWHKKGSIEH